MDNLTAIVPFWNGQRFIDKLLDSLPDWLSVIVVDDHSDQPLQLSRPGVRVIRPKQKGFFSGAVNAGMAACNTDALVLNQDAKLHGEAWVDLLKKRRHYAIIGDGVMGHPAWPRGYVQGTFMYIKRGAWETVGPLNARDYPLWGATCEWQLRACRKGFKALPVEEVPGLRHRDRPGVGRAIAQAVRRWPDQRRRFLQTPPLISVIMPCYNYARYLPDAINSLIGGPTSLGDMPGQTLQSFEIIIVDDASTDDTPEVGRQLADRWQGIRYMRLPKNRGTAGALNAGIEQAYGKFIHILSADDMRESWALDKLYRVCETDENSVAYSDVMTFANGKRARRLPMHQYDFDKLLYQNQMPAGIMYSKAAWEVVGGYPASMRYGREDWALNIALGANGFCGIKVDGKPGNLYRRERQNRSLRTQGWYRRFLGQMRAMWPDLYEGSRPMGCCGGRGSARPRKSVRESRPLPGKDGFEVLEYVGLNDGAGTYWGPATGTAYRFGDNGVGRQKWVRYVDVRDAPGLLDMREGGGAVFRVFRDPQSAELNLSPAEAARVNA